MPEYRTVRHSDEGVQALAAFGGCVLSILLVSYSVVLTGWVTSVLWGWFIQSTFHVSALSLPVAIGVSAIVRLLIYNAESISPAETAEERNRRLASVLVGPWAVLLLGWIAHSFV